MNGKPMIPKRFIIRVLCNRCGLGSAVNFTWMPNMALGFDCLSCGEIEIFHMGPQEQTEDVPLTPEEQKTIQGILKKKVGKPEGEDNKN